MDVCNLHCLQVLNDPNKTKYSQRNKDMKICVT